MPEDQPITPEPTPSPPRSQGRWMLVVAAVLLTALWLFFAIYLSALLAGPHGLPVSASDPLTYLFIGQIIYVCAWAVMMFPLLTGRLWAWWGILASMLIPLAACLVAFRVDRWHVNFDPEGTYDSDWNAGLISEFAIVTSIALLPALVLLILYRVKNRAGLRLPSKQD